MGLLLFYYNIFLFHILIVFKWYYTIQSKITKKYNLYNEMYNVNQKLRGTICFNEDQSQLDYFLIWIEKERVWSNNWVFQSLQMFLISFIFKWTVPSLMFLNLLICKEKIQVINQFAILKYSEPSGETLRSPIFTRIWDTQTWPGDTLHHHLQRVSPCSYTPEDRRQSQ